jgi:hypothetical protein
VFYEEFELFGDFDDPLAEYVTDDLKIWYYLNHMSDGISDICRVISHEWLHGLFDWATDEPGNSYQHACDMTDGEGDHFIMKVINYYD